MQFGMWLMGFEHLTRKIYSEVYGRIAVLAIVAVVAFNVNLNQNLKIDMSSLVLANVETLAQKENDGGSNIRISFLSDSGYNNIIVNKGLYMNNYL